MNSVATFYRLLLLLREYPLAPLDVPYKLVEKVFINVFRQIILSIC